MTDHRTARVGEAAGHGSPALRFPEPETRHFRFTMVGGDRTKVHRSMVTGQIPDALLYVPTPSSLFPFALPYSLFGVRRRPRRASRATPAPAIATGKSLSSEPPPPAPVLGSSTTGAVVGAGGTTVAGASVAGTSV